jgi:hypothetical protein
VFSDRWESQRAAQAEDADREFDLKYLTQLALRAIGLEMKYDDYVLAPESKNAAPDRFHRDRYTSGGHAVEGSSALDRPY